MASVRYWHLADIGLCAAHVCYWGQSGHWPLLNSRAGHMEYRPARGSSQSPVVICRLGGPARTGMLNRLG